ncbi:MAG: signal peptidase [Pseudomonadota bacterium]|nr:signal peptidase [Pseudomonadota bacterium]
MFVVVYLVVLLASVFISRTLVYKNVSISEQLGYYLLIPGAKIRKNDLILLCVNDNYKHVFNELGLRDVAGQCRNGLPYLLKRIAAVTGDRVEVENAGIKINGKLYPNSKQFAEGRGVKLYPLQLGYSRILGKEEYFMLGNSLHSVDSRYFGVVKSSDIHGKVVLVYETQKVDK